MVKDTKRKTRKRRSFWEPESKDLVAWLNNQADLGKSLQLIIVDAMQQYGRGDAVDAYLQRRLDSDFKEPQIATKPALTEGQDLHGPVGPGRLTLDGQPVEPTVLDVVDDAAVESESEPEPEVDLVDDLDVVESEPVKEPAKESVKTETKPPQSEDDYDPLEVMFGDIDSGLNK